ncbi:MAG: hypothetical protein JWN93_1834 [Hyphomicrobiales bacterium]|nr:hypothetical protein [Hyphomicrobiales bacterium]
MEWKDKYFKLNCPRCGVENHVIVTYDGAKSSSDETGLCYACNEPLHTEKCFMVWVAPSRKEVERRVARAAGLARVL